jgi:hypothetical protein
MGFRGAILFILTMTVTLFAFQNCSNTSENGQTLTSSSTTSGTPYSGATNGDVTALKLANPLSAAGLEDYLRKSCYCIDCHKQENGTVDGRDRMIAAVGQTGCRYLRWAAFPWHEHTLSDQQIALNKYQQTLNGFKTMVEQLP